MELRGPDGKPIFHIDRLVSFRDRSGYSPYYRDRYPSYRTTPYRQPQYQQPDRYFRPQEPPYDPWAQMDQIFSEAGLTRGEHGYDASGLRSIDFPIDPFISSQDTYDASHLRSKNYYDVFETTDQIMERQGLRQTNISGVYDAEGISNHGRNFAEEIGARAYHEFGERLEQMSEDDFAPTRELPSTVDGILDGWKVEDSKPSDRRQTPPISQEVSEESTSEEEYRSPVDRLLDIWQEEDKAQEKKMERKSKAKEQTSTKDAAHTEKIQSTINLFNLRLQDDGKYSRYGHQGKYYLQSDGSFWYEPVQDDTKKPHTLINGRQDPAREKPLPYTKELTSYKLKRNPDGSYSAPNIPGHFYIQKDMETIYYTGDGTDQNKPQIMKPDRTSLETDQIPASTFDIAILKLFPNPDRNSWSSGKMTGEFKFTENDIIERTYIDPKNKKQVTEYYYQGTWDQKKNDIPKPSPSP